MKLDWFTHDRYEQAVATSAATDKPILIYFHSKSCGGCNRLASEVLASERVQLAIAKSAVPVWIEVEAGRADPRLSALVGSHIFIMSPVVQLISSTGDIFHKFLRAPLHTRLDLGYTRVHHDVAGTIDPQQFLSQLTLGLAKGDLSNGNFARAGEELAALAAQLPDALAAAEVAYWLPIARSGGRYEEDAQPHSDLHALSEIANEVRRFCSLIGGIPDTELMADWPGKRGHGGWAHYTDCLREVCLGVYQTLLDAGNRATTERLAHGNPLTQAQLIMRDWQTSYRTLQGTLHGLCVYDWDRQHLHENYSRGKQRTIRNNVVHCVMAEFWAHGSAIRRTREIFAGAANDGAEPVDATWRKFGPPPVNFGTRSDLFQTWEERHEALVEEFATVDDDELDFERGWWEGSGVSIRFRLNRLGWHLQDHAAVVETICERLGRARSETERLMVRIFTALGSAEGAMIGLSAETKRSLFAEAIAQLRGKSEEMQAIYARYSTGDRPLVAVHELTTAQA
jgi:hypothetical protein